MVYAQQHSKFPKQPEQTGRRRKYHKTKKTQRTSTPDPNGFLRKQFLPLLESGNPLAKNSRAIEQSFFNALKNLAALYGFEMPASNARPYPLNIAYAYRCAKGALKDCNQQLSLLIMQDETRNTCLATAQHFEVGNTLYYVPVRPLFDLLKNKKNSALANLLFSVFSYLYNVAGLPWFGDSSSYIAASYDTLGEWYLENDEQQDPTETLEILTAFDTMRKGGKSVLKRMRKRVHLQQFERRLRLFKPVNKKEKAGLQVAKQAYGLMTLYPGRNLFRSIPENLFEPDTEQRVLPEHYLSFIWDSNDFIYDQLVEYVNSYLQECTVMDEPVSLQFFDTPQQRTTHDLSFETNLFQMLDDLCTLLNEMP